MHKRERTAALPDPIPPPIQELARRYFEVYPAEVKAYARAIPGPCSSARWAAVRLKVTRGSW